ncbi:MAG: 3-isopropylmalate dehydrogenase [Christensenellaceae bacterium]|jgi:3-isopropylmalate dehydrogenase|nr:3-isopropylmalate dehydrogenase [Christensenellaceae bacterium]
MNKKYKIALLPGDGIGPEVTCAAVSILKKVASKFKFDIIFKEAVIGGDAIDKTGNPLPEETVNICKESDAVLMGAVGGPKWDNLPGELRPEKGILGIRMALGLFANLRPAIVYDALKSSSPLRADILDGGLDIMVVRELTGGIYFGERGRRMKDGCLSSFDTEEYTQKEVERIAHVAFKASMKRKKKVCSVDKANVLESSRFWREIVINVKKEYPEVELMHLYVDNAAMQIVRNPGQFDVLLTNNIFGDILSDEASQITGSIGMLPSASIGYSTLGLYEPIHGSAPDITGKNIANPLATILSVAMMLRYSLNEDSAAKSIEQAVIKTLDQGYRTSDINASGCTIVNTNEMALRVLENI